MNIRGILIAALGSLTLFSLKPVLRAQTINMQYVTVGNPGNAADTAVMWNGDKTTNYGSVGYTYNIGKYDVTDSQYCTFLNAVDPKGANALGLYWTGSYAEYGIACNAAAANGSKYSVITGYANMPVVYLTYWDVLRFCNWMDNGEKKGSTETGAYTLLGESPTPSNAAALLENPQHNAGATVWLPSENEWYKAAYYDPTLNSGIGGYWMYATQSNSAPGNVVGNSPNQANYRNENGYSVTQSSSRSSRQNYLTPVGAFTSSASYYGTYDQAGDVWNWTSTIILSSQSPVARGGSWQLDVRRLSSSFRNSVFHPSVAAGLFGFRVAKYP